jgi:death-on-curing protein
LESAVAAPAQSFGGQLVHEDIPAIAGAYAFHICMNHPFVDGNKRAGTAAMIAFLTDNAWRFDATADEAEPVILSLAAGKLDKTNFTEWLRKYAREKQVLDLREFFGQLSYMDISEFLEASLAHDNPNQSQKERFDTIMEAASVPSALN